MDNFDKLFTQPDSPYFPKPEPQQQNAPVQNQQDSTQTIANAISSLKETADSIIASQTNNQKALEAVTYETKSF